MIEMEDEDGRAVPMTAVDLANAIRQSGKPVPLIFLASCLSGVSGSDTVGLAQELLQHGMPLVLAMQSSVSDWYATRLAGSFYEQLSRMEVPLASHALAVARQEVETARRQAVERGELAGTVSGRIRHAVAVLRWPRAPPAGPLSAAGNVAAAGVTIAGGGYAPAVDGCPHWPAGRLTPSHAGAP